MMQLIQLRDDHINQLGTAERAFTQAIERAQANVEWRSRHYNEVLQWLKEHY